MTLRSRPSTYEHFLLSFPCERVVQVTLNRPEKLNSITKETSSKIAEIWDLFDQDESLWVGIITGSGRAFCTGADLGEWNEMVRSGVVNDMSPPGLAGLPRRSGKKPIIAAVNGICMGGGFEMVANCDLVIASSTATFALPETKRGIVAVAGCPSIDAYYRPATTLYDWGLITRLIDPGTNIAQAAAKLAGQICQNSPDATIVGRQGVRLSWEAGSAEDAVTTLAKDWYPRLCAGENFAEGIRAFVEKRSPNWVNSKL
ncbi:enoyl-CoA hydratase/isomerase family protein [Penicillium chermesinum]|uniref:Enoyl-CoA hydratase/isomerase family protein n=1 Tax=Penicillium chermesinum TaxID=63820 RepID=A0A9W9NIM4_9EURO|nr:enoyl-CoA hydratase/isomerase family protein [Penicillium chermesinum]KAJ5220438.1 enoyl-CoA hydratase/isomerase family protein [Penicillium chermesinum]